MKDEMKRLVFLGFGFDATNGALLFGEDTESYLGTRLQERRVFANGLIITETSLMYTNYGNSALINRRIQKLFPNVLEPIVAAGDKGVYEAMAGDFDLS